MNNQDMIQIYYRTTDLWSNLCELHADLFDRTCEEYQLLLENRLEDLEKTIAEKEMIVERVHRLEAVRQKIIDQINAELNGDIKIEKASELLLFLEPISKDIGQNHLAQFNRILIDIIEKIQDQNKKNQIFLNKAIDSIDKLRREVSGQKIFHSYDRLGKVKNVGGRL